MRQIWLIGLLALWAATAADAALAQGPISAPGPTLNEIEQARNTYIFQFQPDIPADQAADKANEMASFAGGAIRHVYTTALLGFAMTVPEEALQKLMDEFDELAGFERDRILRMVEPAKCADDPSAPGCSGDGGGGDVGATAIGCSVGSASEYPWGVDRVDAEKAHGGGQCGSNIHAYVLDTGIDLAHADLQPIAKSVDCTRRGGCRTGGNDDNGHGTHVAGSIGARVNNQGVVGVAPAVDLHSVKVLRKTGIGFLSDIIAGIDWVAVQVGQNGYGGKAVANMSLGGSGSKTGTCSASGFSGSDAFHKAICNATRVGVVFVVAAGNDGKNSAGFVPAAYDDTVVTVSATFGDKLGPDDGDTTPDDGWPSWSNFGSVVDIAAPGVNIVSTRLGGGTTTLSGTSMASPHAAGGVALYLGRTSQSATYTAFTNARSALLSTAEDSSVFSDPTTSASHDEGFLNACALAGQSGC